MDLEANAFARKNPHMGKGIIGDEKAWFRNEANFPLLRSRYLSAGKPKLPTVFP